MPAATALPIWKIHADILRTLHAGKRLVLVAPTGSGKATQVSQMLLDAGTPDGKRLAASVSFCACVPAASPAAHSGATPQLRDRMRGEMMAAKIFGPVRQFTRALPPAMLRSTSSVRMTLHRPRRQPVANRSNNTYPPE